MSAGEVNVKFGADLSSLNSAVTSAKSTLGSFGDSLKSLFSGVDTSKAQAAFKGVGDSADQASDQSSSAIGKIKTTLEDVTLGAGALAVAAIASLMGVAAAAIAIGDPIRTAAGAFNQSVESISALNSVAARSGVSLDALGASFLKLQSNAAAGDAGTIAALKAIGLTAGDMAGLTQDALAVKMAGSFSAAADTSNKAATGVALFGADVASKLVPQLDQGAAHIKSLEDAANRAGVVIGADLSARIAGTNAQMQAFGDAVQELGQSFKGLALEKFASFKPAIDGMVAAFSDAVRNVTSLVEWFGNLNGAGQKVADTTGIMSQAVAYFSSLVVRATSYVQELAIKGAQYINTLGIAFNDLSTVAAAFATDLVSVATGSASAFYTVFHDAISGVITLFGDLATAGKNALSFDLTGVRSSFSQFGSDAEAMGSKFKAALTPSFAGTTAAMDAMRAHATQESAELDKVIAKLEAQKAAQLALIAAGGAKRPTPGTTKVGDPSAPEEDKGAGDKANAQIAEIAGEIAVLRKAMAQKEELYASDVKLKLMSEGEKLTKTKSALDEEYAAEKALLTKEAQLANLSAEQKAQALSKLKVLDQKYAADTQKIMGEAAENTVEPWFKMVDTMSSSLSESIMGMLEKTKTFRDAIRSMAQAVTAQFVKMGVDVVANWAKGQLSMLLTSNATEAAKTAAAAAGTTAREGITLAGLATESGAFLSHVLAQIGAMAAQAFAGVTAFLSPILGPAAVGPAAGVEATVLAAGAGIGSFAVGAWNLSSDQIANVHKGEMIIPAGPAAALRSGLTNGAADGGSGGGDNHFHSHVSVSAWDGASVDHWLKSGGNRLLEKHVTALWKQGHVAKPWKS